MSWAVKQKFDFAYKTLYTNGGQTASPEPQTARERKFCGSYIES